MQEDVQNRRSEEVRFSGSCVDPLLYSWNW